MESAGENPKETLMCTPLQVFAIEFVPFAVEFVTFAVEFVGFAIKFVILAIEFNLFTMLLH